MILVIGEGMLELLPSDGAWQLGYGGDTLNTALHLARLGNAVALVSALGEDPFSDTLRRAWAGEGLDLSLLRTDPERVPALYAIATDSHGERSFTYWRNSSAGRRMFDLRENDDLRAAAARAELLYFSMISLAILPPHGRERVFELCELVRAGGGRVAFDSNFRPALWESAAAARDAHARAIARCDIGLPTLEDEHRLLDLDHPAAVAETWRNGGAGEVVVKLGRDGCWTGDALCPVPATVVPIDTTGAGDAFNAGYLHGRLRDRSAAESAMAGHRLAGWVISKRGGIPASAPDAPYAALQAT